MQNYVVGFLFSEDMERVALIEKNKPEWQKGWLNGIGGKIEAGETAAEAMQREFYEETGCVGYAWEHFYTMTNFSDYRLYIFKAKGDLDNLESPTDEKVGIYEVARLRSLPVIPNLNWIIPFAMDWAMTGEGVSR